VLATESQPAPPLILGNAIKTIFPAGTRRGQAGTRSQGADWSLVPIFPTDVFAAASLLVETAGIYQSIYPYPYVPHASRAALGGHITKSPQVVEDQAAKWIKEATDHIAIAGVSGSTHIEDFDSPVQEYWTTLWDARDLPIHSADAKAPAWWDAAIMLLLVSDAAAADIGFPSRRSNVFNHVPRDVSAQKNVPLSTHATLVSQDIACVQPKSRVPVVGCTIRSFSHNLALLPPRRVAVAKWHYLKETNAKKASEPLNIVLIPYPYSVSARCFRPYSDTGMPQEATEWGWFDVRQRWLTERGDPRDIPREEPVRLQARASLTQFVSAIVNRAAEDVGEIHGVIFPELALDWNTLSQIYSSLRRSRGSSLEFVISGVSTNADSEEGNFVAVLMKDGTAIVRPKHHRWKLDADQIRRYALASALDPKRDWWEHIYLPNRSIDVLVFREASTLSTLICEDLARIDPCQQLVRAIGPNLVLVLLMDSAQRRARWPARYATVLAEDPGSSVLTLTSLGLVQRANAAGLVETSRSIALWRDDSGEAREITLPEGAQAVVITLSGADSPQRTFDGRGNSGEAYSWRLDGQLPVQINIETAMEWIFRPR
jgi:hypothetical protein